MKQHQNVNMAHLLASYPNISELSYGLITVSRPARRTRLITNCVVHCSSSSSSSGSSSTEEVGFVGSGKFGIDSKGEFKYLVSEYGWKVRSLFRNGDEVRQAAQVQAEAFHEPVFLFNDLFFQFFQVCFVNIIWDYVLVLHFQS